MFKIKLARLLAGMFTLGVGARAANFSFQGTFGTDDQVELINFTLNSAATANMVSFGYGGGTNSMGTAIPPGGFDTFFTLFAGDGSQIDTNDDGGCGNVNAGNGGCFDAWLSENLAAGSYTLALTQSGNDPMGSLSDGFTEQGQGNFTCPQGFCDAFGDQQNGSWAVDILNVDSASQADAGSAAPEPGSYQLTGVALLLLTLGFHSRIQRQFKGRS
jgi:hypothetical protein